MLQVLDRFVYLCLVLTVVTHQLRSAAFRCVVCQVRLFGPKVAVAAASHLLDDPRPRRQQVTTGMWWISPHRPHLIVSGLVSHILHVWYIYLHDWVIIRANVGKYTIHGAYGQWNSSPALIFSIEAVRAPKELTRT